VAEWRNPVLLSQNSAARGRRASLPVCHVLEQRGFEQRVSEPGDLVNRDAERDQLLRILEDYRITATETHTASAREARILISGERGVGKSILTRRVLADFEARHPDQIHRCHSGRAKPSLQAVLTEIAKALVHAGPASGRRSTARSSCRSWSYVDLLAEAQPKCKGPRQNPSRGSTELGLGLHQRPLVKLTSLFSWEETRQLRRDGAKPR